MGRASASVWMRMVAVGIAVVVGNLACVSIPAPIAQQPMIDSECVEACRTEVGDCEDAAMAGHCLMAPVYIVGVALLAVLVLALVAGGGGGGDCGNGNCGNGPIGHDVACQDIVETCERACMGMGPGSS